MTDSESSLPEDSMSEEAPYRDESIVDEDDPAALEEETLEEETLEEETLEEDALEEDALEEDALEEDALEEDEEEYFEEDELEEDIEEEELEEAVALDDEALEGDEDEDEGDEDLEDDEMLEEQGVPEENESPTVEPVSEKWASEDAETNPADTSGVTPAALSGASFQPDISGNPLRWKSEDPKSCLVRRKGDGELVVDATAGRISALGLNCDALSDSIRSVADAYLGDALATIDFDDSDARGSHGRLVSELLGLFQATDLDGWFTSVLLESSAELALERAIILSRCHRSQKAYRTVALVGSDHGRSFLCRTASGQPELQENLGPLVAGFAHVPADDASALDAVVDDQTAAVLVSPNLWSRGGHVLDVEYLRRARSICDERNVLLISDESRVVFGSTGQPLAIVSVAGVRPDLAILSAGLFGGLAGGITLVSERVADRAAEDRLGVGDPCHPVLASVASTAISEISRRSLLASVTSTYESFAVELAERASRFEFVRDIHAMGLSIGLETDLDSLSLVQAAKQNNVKMEAAGDTAVRLQPPLVMSDDDRRLLLDAVEETLSSIQLATADLGI
ncbi:MAG: aminotransferase class III-fold pyridoxal phosphate-dependent enzyme [Planctomycetota bacterium]